MIKHMLRKLFKCKVYCRECEHFRVAQNLNTNPKLSQEKNVLAYVPSKNVPQSMEVKSYIMCACDANTRTVEFVTHKYYIVEDIEFNKKSNKNNFCKFYSYNYW